MKRVLVLLAAVAAVLVPAAAADAPDISFGVRFGLAVDDSGFAGLPFELTNDSGVTLGLRMGYRRGHWAGEVVYLHADRSLIPKPEALPGLESTTFRLNSLSFNVLYFPLLHATLQPYLTAGYAYYRLDFVGYDQDRTGGFNVGAGLDLLLLPHVSVSLEAKHHWVDFLIGGVPFDFRAWAANLGLSYHF
jgi:opacity protein-like surface antigen